MDRREFSSSVQAAWAFLRSIGIAEVFANPNPLPFDEGFRNLVLRGSEEYSALYRYCLERSFYNILTFDHSFFHFGWSSPDSIRFAFYPNPYVSEEGKISTFRKYREMVSSGNISEDEFSRLAEGLASQSGVPVFRYEYAPDQRVSLAHPTSHMHIGYHSSNRWCVGRVLTPAAFAMLIAKHYFSPEWSLSVEEVAAGEINPNEQALIAERSRCRIMPEELLDSHETSSFMLT